MKGKALFLAEAAACMAGFAGTLYLAFYRAELDAKLFFNQKIFYYHVANAFMLFAATITCGVASLLYLRRRQSRHDDLAMASGELAVLFGAVVLSPDRSGARRPGTAGGTGTRGSPPRSSSG